MNAKRRGEELPPPVKISIMKSADADFAAYIEVELAPGADLITKVRPFARTDAAVARSMDVGYRWEAQAEAKLLFSAGHACNAQILYLNQSSYVVAADLALMWTPEVQFQNLAALGMPALTWAGGGGRLVLRVPGYTVSHTGGDRRYRSELVDPAHFVWTKSSVPWVDIEVDGAGHQWIRLTGQDALAHSYERPDRP